MIVAWYELKTKLVEFELKPPGIVPSIIYTIVLSNMNEIESKYACESLKEAGY